MSKQIIGALFIFAGLIYGSFGFDQVRSKTIGWLVENEWIKQPNFEIVKKEQFLGPKSTIFFYSIIAIALGIYMIFSK